MLTPVPIPRESPGRPDRPALGLILVPAASAVSLLLAAVLWVFVLALMVASSLRCVTPRRHADRRSSASGWPEEWH